MNTKTSKILELANKKRLYFDGGTGTVLQSMGLPSGTPPELWSLSHPDKITALHKAYFEVGCNIIKTNTFGVNPSKYDNFEELVVAAINCAKAARDGYGIDANKFIALDIGPTGRMLSPLGDLDFEDAVTLFRRTAEVGIKNGVDMVLIETMTDAYETKAAVVGVKEAMDALSVHLPIAVTNAYGSEGLLMTGADVVAMAVILEGLGVDIIGLNCSTGPSDMLPLVKKLAGATSLPLVVNPNAGLPSVADGKTVYNMGADEFSDIMCELAKYAHILGGCCGTTPEYIKATIEKTKDIPLPDKVNFKKVTRIASYTHAVEIGGDAPVRLIGERINPTGKPKLKAALREQDLEYILDEAQAQIDAKVHVLDVNVGLPEINEAEIMVKVVNKLQAISDIPLQIDSSNPEVLERAIRRYNGKPLVNSVTGTKASMESVFPIVKKYGGVVIALTMDESGIPATAAERFAIAQNIISVAATYGIDACDIVVDPLALTISSSPDAALVTLDTIKLLRENGILSSLGVSNISFGLPRRDIINSAFFAEALCSGLNLAIMNPFAEGMMNVYYAHIALSGKDTACSAFIEYASLRPQEGLASKVTAIAPKAETLDDRSPLARAIINGRSEVAVSEAKELVNKGLLPLDIINNEVISALGVVGEGFEKKKLFLPQLLMSADSACSAVEELRSHMKSDAPMVSKGKIILATVKGDIHDIGKNIVKILLESYGFDVIDLGRDVSPEAVLDAAKVNDCKLIGLSALMTTTVPSMKETIEVVRASIPDAYFIVGGAVLNEDYAKMINADLYSPEAMDTVRAAEEYYTKG